MPVTLRPVAVCRYKRMCCGSTIPVFTS